MAAFSQFFLQSERELSDQFIAEGYVIRPVEHRDYLDQIRNLVKEAACKWLGTNVSDAESFLNHAHEIIPAGSLNDFRLSVIDKLNQDSDSRWHYFSLARGILEILVGNELSMQNRLNLSIQLPNDDSSLLPIHADVWSGDSPYEVVVWLPLVDCYGSKSMFLLPPNHAACLHSEFSDYANKSSEEVYQRIKPHLKWIEINYGEVLIFNQNLPHGNRINAEMQTRWSLNCRFKSIFSPYGDKKLGEFFEPITLRAASRIGMNYKFPEVD